MTLAIITVIINVCTFYGKLVSSKFESTTLKGKQASTGGFKLLTKT